MTELEQILAMRDTARQLGDYWAGLIRALDFDALAADLESQIDENPSRFAALSRAALRGAVTISGWEELAADMAALTAKGRQVTALGIDLTGHCEGAEPGFEISFYGDSSFAFSTATRENLLAASGDYSTPWQGDFLECEPLLECRGLAALHTAIREYPDRFVQSGPLPQDFAGFTIALWILYLRIHRTIAETLAARGLPQAIPVIVGEHDFGPTCNGVYMVERLSDDGQAAARILAERAEANRLHYDRYTEQMIAEMREKRALVRSWPWWRARAQRKNAIEMFEAGERLIFADIPSGAATGPVWSLSDASFELLADRLREHRRPGSSAETVRADPGDTRSQLHLLFLQHGLKFGGKRVQRDFVERRQAAA